MWTSKKRSERLHESLFARSGRCPMKAAQAVGAYRRDAQEGAQLCSRVALVSQFRWACDRQRGRWSREVGQGALFDRSSPEGSVWPGWHRGVPIFLEEGVAYEGACHHQEAADDSAATRG